MVLKTCLDTEKENLIAFIWLLPLIPMLAIFILFLCYGRFSWVVLLMALAWAVLWGCVYRNTQTEIRFEGEKITLRLQRKIYVISMADILYIEQTAFHGKPRKLHAYKIYMRPNVNIPSAYLFVRNKKIQENLSVLFPGVSVKQNVVLD